MRRTLALLLIAAAPATLLVATTGSPAGAGGNGCGSPQTIIVEIDENGGSYENSTPEVPTVFLDLADTGEPPHSIDFAVLPQTWGVVSATVEWRSADEVINERISTYSAPVVSNSFGVDEAEDFQGWGGIATFNVVNCGSGQTTTTTVGSTTSTTVGGSVSPSSTATQPATLPRTGSNLTLSWLAAIALLLGTSFLVIARRITESRP